ncbi:MAG: energy transducer TonB [Sphingobium sp.]
MMAALRSPWRMGVPAAASLAVNGLLLLVLLGLGVGRERRADSPSLTIMSLAALKGAEDGADRREPAEAVSEAAPTMPAPSVQQAPTPPAFTPPPVPVLPTLAQSRPLVVRPETPSGGSPSHAPAQATTQPAAAAAGAPPPRGQADGLDADAPAGRSLGYAAKVRSWLYAHKVYPRRARMRHEEGIVRVRFVIDRMGMLVEGAVIGSSGKTSLDEEAAAMMRRASPFPKAPATITSERIEFTAPIEFMLPV